MNWDAVGALAELAGAIAVVITLVFLVAQMRQNTKALRAETLSNASNAVQEWYLQFGGNAQSTEVFMKGMQNPNECTPSEYLQFVSQVQAIFLAYQTIFRLELYGALDTEVADSFNNIILNGKDQPGFKRFWDERADQFDDRFRQFVDETMSSDFVPGGASIFKQR